MSAPTSAREFFAHLGESKPGFRIPLHSDTATLPTPAMREAMAAAPVGDEQRQEDPTVNALQAEIANILGKEAAVFLPSATMANQIAVRLHCRQGEEVLCHESAHIMGWEAGGMAGLSGVQPHPVKGERGIFSAATCGRAARGENLHNPRTALIAIENTTNVPGGYAWTPDEIGEVVQFAQRRGLPTHCDGSRLFNAAIALASGRVSGTSHGAAVQNDWRRNDAPSTMAINNAAQQLARGLDTVTICFSKGLGAPVGAALVGTRADIQRALRLKHQFGGAMRQAGIIAAGALYALRNHLPQMVDDHRRARRLAEGLHAVEGLTIPPEDVQSNILIVTVTREDMDCGRVASSFQARGVGCYPFGRCFRLVTHLDITDTMVEEVIRMAPEVMGNAAGTQYSRDPRVRVGY